MRSPGAVYRKYRQIKKKLIYDKIVEAKKVKHCNCFYGKLIEQTDELGYKSFIKLCLYNMNKQGDVDICVKPQECNAFALKWNKEKIIKKFEEDISNYKNKQKLYPELCAYEWVLDKNLYDAIKKPGFFGKILIILIEFLENLLKSYSGAQS